MDGRLKPDPTALRAANDELADVNARLAFALENPLSGDADEVPPAAVAAADFARLEQRLGEVERQSRNAELRIDAAASALGAILTSRSWLVVRGFRALKRLPRR